MYTFKHICCLYIDVHIYIHVRNKYMYVYYKCFYAQIYIHTYKQTCICVPHSTSESNYLLRMKSTT